MNLVQFLGQMSAISARRIRPPPPIRPPSNSGVAGLDLARAGFRSVAGLAGHRSTAVSTRLPGERAGSHSDQFDSRLHHPYDGRYVVTRRRDLMFPNVSGATQQYLADVNRTETQLQTVTPQISSGLAVKQPSDNPETITEILQDPEPWPQTSRFRPTSATSPPRSTPPTRRCKAPSNSCTAPLRWPRRAHLDQTPPRRATLAHRSAVSSRLSSGLRKPR